MHMIAVGGSDAGISAALRAREVDPGAEVTVVVADAYPNFSICGIPYYVSGEVPHWRNLAHRTIADLEAAGIALRLDTTARRIDVAGRKVLLTGPGGAEDVVAWDQLGCLSPHVIYVEAGGELSAEQFAEALAQELERREETEPRGEVPVEAAAAIASRRSFYEIRAAHSPDTRHWCSRNSTAWTVVYEADPRFQLSCLNRFIYVKGVKDLAEALQGADSVRGKVSTVGLAAVDEGTCAGHVLLPRLHRRLPSRPR